MHLVTAKAKIDATSVQTFQSWNDKTQQTEEVKEVRVSMQPDYVDPANKEWATATPNLSVNMTVHGKVADLFVQGKKVTIIFQIEE